MPPSAVVAFPADECGRGKAHVFDGAFAFDLLFYAGFGIGGCGGLVEPHGLGAAFIHFEGLFAIASAARS